MIFIILGGPMKTTTYKAWVALGGSIVTALVASPAIPVDSKVHAVLAILSTLITGVGTYQVPYTVDVKRGDVL